MNNKEIQSNQRIIQIAQEFLKTTHFDPNFAQPIIPNLPELN
jgi:hypothetical protein